MADDWGNQPGGRNDGHKFDFSKITEHIYIGSDLCRGGICLVHAEEFKKLGVTVEINLSKEDNELPPSNIEGYTWLPVEDGHAPTFMQLQIGTKVIHEAIKDGRTVYVHCRNGHARSPTLVVAYLIKYGGYTIEKAIEVVKSRREEIHIEEVQMKSLTDFVETRKISKS